MGVGGAPGRGVQLSNWTLAFSDAHLEQDFRARERRAWGATELWRLKLNLMVGLINLSITTYLLSLGVFTKQGISIVAPYMTVAVLHYCLAAWCRGKGRCSLINLFAETCYSLICTLSMSSWVLHGECVELKVFLRKLILGSGVLIGMWCRFFTPTLFAQAVWLTPLQFVFQAWPLTAPTCGALVASPYSTAALQRLLTGLSKVARCFTAPLQQAVLTAWARWMLTAAATACCICCSCLRVVYCSTLFTAWNGAAGRLM